MRYSQIKKALREAEIIDEVSMSPTSLEAFANSPEADGMLIGVEFEMCVPDASTGDNEPEWEYDYEYNESARDIDEILNFFRNGDFSNMSRSDSERYRSELYDEYLDWTNEAANRYIDDNTDELDSLIRDRLEGEIDRADVKDEARTRWIEANPNEDPDSDDAAADIRVITLEMIEDRVDELMADTSSREYQYAYDQARQEMEDDFRNSGDGDQEAWLSDIGVSDMQDAERQWGFDWPHMYDSNEGNYGGDADVDDVANNFESSTGYEAKGYTNYHSGNRSQQQQEGYFIIEPDASIDANQGDAGLEFISPAMPLKDGLEMIKKVQAWAKKTGCYTNKSTGLHMNISVPNMTTDNLDYVKLALFLGDEYVLQEFGRAYNSYAKSAMAIVREKIQANPENATALLAKMKEHLGAAASKLVHSGVTQKYTSINTKDNYVEFRGPGGDYLDEDIPKLLNTALRAAQALRIATDDTAYKQEYAKKLYKLISPEGEWTDPNNSVALFSRYALGQINKSELVSNVRQAQTARKEKKGEEQQYWVMNKDGSGGKQMVFATSSTEAIIKGGKQMGMSREDSISRLKAELMEKPQDSNTAPASVPLSWIDWIADTLPTVTVDTINSVRERMTRGGGENLDADASGWIVKQIDNELRNRMDQGVVDGNETRWKVYFARGRHVDQDPVFVDADSPRQAKLKAADIFMREQRISVGLHDLEAIATTQDAGRPEVTWNIINGLGEPAGTVNARTSDEALHVYGSVNNVDTRYYRATPAETASSAGTYTSFADAQAAADRMNAGTAPTTSREVFDSLSNVWQDWLQDIRNKTDGNLQRILDNMVHGVNAHFTNLEPGQIDFIVNTVNQELQRRSGNNATASAAGSAENAVRDSLPTAHRDWLDNVADKSDMDLINVLRNVSTTAVLNDQQTAYFRVIIKRELRRRGISSERDASEQGATPVPNYEIYAPDSGVVVHQFHADNETDANRKFSEFEQNYESDYDFHHEYRRIGPAQQELPLEPAVPQTTATDFEVVRDDGSIVSRIQGADMVYAHRKARELEQDLGLENGALTVRALPTATNESIKELRRLAGLA
jgi:hypothetical protein